MKPTPPLARNTYDQLWVVAHGQNQLRGSLRGGLRCWSLNEYESPKTLNGHTLNPGRYSPPGEETDTIVCKRITVKVYPEISARYDAGVFEFLVYLAGDTGVIVRAYTYP